MGTDWGLAAFWLLNWLILGLALFGAVRHFRDVLYLREECRIASTPGDKILCRHYLRHEVTRARVKLYLFLIGVYFVLRPIAVIDPQYGIWGPVFLRCMILVILFDLTREGQRSREDRAEIAKLPGIRESE